MPDSQAQINPFVPDGCATCGDPAALKRFCQYKFAPPTVAEGEDAIGTAQSPERTGLFES